MLFKRTKQASEDQKTVLIKSEPNDVETLFPKLWSNKRTFLLWEGSNVRLFLLVNTEQKTVFISYDIPALKLTGAQILSCALKCEELRVARAILKQLKH